MLRSHPDLVSTCSDPTLTGEGRRVEKHFLPELSNVLNLILEVSIPLARILTNRRTEQYNYNHVSRDVYF
jgi:hypothetical protein